MDTYIVQLLLLMEQLKGYIVRSDKDTFTVQLPLLNLEPSIIQLCSVRSN
jgi:hypothetical protein